MWALVTGASSGIGRDMARYLYLSLGYNLIIVARNEDKLLELKQEEGLSQAQSERKQEEKEIEERAEQKRQELFHRHAAGDKGTDRSLCRFYRAVSLAMCVISAAWIIELPLPKQDTLTSVTGKMK